MSQANDALFPSDLVRQGEIVRLAASVMAGLIARLSPNAVIDTNALAELAIACVTAIIDRVNPELNHV